MISGAFLLGIIGVNVGLVLAGNPIMRILTLLPMTAYLPMIICYIFCPRHRSFKQL